ncbi:MAG: acetyl-CoA acetyltransferase [Deltaproteobacteria bacterium]|jgi:acetyl-CoA C-acetyltransferase|nr:acetyl-CoA acetyltransferase [Deltaproteobacteria bacterium]MBT4639141.1 acetyl-CoA acetyltransferase [Deltaproteobacteria bacterium]MBT6504750.1 acetyl-CoA acetyltransferase [Deltaproteobacteria bacterium]MBT7712737.1 acetyl-CoA acetyltransferase [Deltaproteobacteria bacterium]MBT7891360.1 acetyl-CoA acetyltransferase [Deltaproteobacteria bacterium]
MATGIKDKVAILGMGCSKFGERWDCGAEELVVESFSECLADAGIEKKEIQAAYFGTHIDEIGLGKAATPLGSILKLPYIPVTRTENYCATATEAFRAACYAVAAGAYDIVLALGVEKLKDTGYGGLPIGSSFGTEMMLRGSNFSAPGLFAQLATAYAATHGVSMDQIKDAIAHVSEKSHANGVLSPKAHLRRAISADRIKAAPMIAYPLGLFDCCGVSDGSAAAIVTTPEIAKILKQNQDIVKVKALQVSVSSGEEETYSSWDGAHFATTRIAATKAYEEAGIKDPRSEISMMEVHDCFSITEFVTMEDLHISPKGGAYEDVMDGFYDLDGQVPCQVDGGLKCFGHPIGASGLRMIYAMYQQLLGRVSEEAQVKNARYGLTHNLGGNPSKNVAAISIIGKG